ncbi:MAG TPA: PA14 domain-containing protein [Myxococcaceae bacterium]|nr:PA14 domain-containing protein [Myxococcaceae bacterium]
MVLSAEGVAAVQRWVNTPAQNFGVVVDNTNNLDGVGFDAREVASAGNRPQLTVTYLPAAGDAGLKGEYFSDTGFSSLALSRTDATVNFDWGSGSPGAGVPQDRFSVRWTGQVVPLYSETYTFYTSSDDGVRLWLDGQPVINNWTDHGPTENSGMVALTAGQAIDMRMEYYENGGGAVAQLSWASARQAKQIVPSSQLRPTSGPTPPPPGGDTAAAGASLPIQYALSSLTGTVYYVSTMGVDTAPGTVAQPLRSLAAAIGKVGAGQAATVVVRGGEYRDNNVNIPAGRAVRIVAYPGEVPVFKGSQKLGAAWIPEGPLAYHAYTAQPVTDGSGISFTTGQNLTGDGVGRYPDQVWIGGTRLRQVSSKTAVGAGRFFVDAANGRLYLQNADAAAGDIEASAADKFITVAGANSTIEGVRVTRFSNSADDYGIIRFSPTADGSVLRHVEVNEAAFQSISYAGSAGDITQGALMDHVTVAGANWMGVTAMYIDGLTLKAVKIVTSNEAGEFTFSPQSGALKTSRCRDIKVLDSVIRDNNSHGLWFDQSNVGTQIAGNRIENNAGSSVFYEISDDLLLINNYVSGGDRAVKLAGSSGLKLVNNTIVGGKDVVGIYTDSRSKDGCADPSQPLCAGSYGSDRDTGRPRPPTLDWKPRLDLMLNNIVVYPTGPGYCGASTGLCITSTNAGANCPVQTILHPAEPARGIPETRIDGNVYANGSGSIVRVPSGSYGNTAVWSAAAGGSPIYLPGLDAHSKSGNMLVNDDGTPTGQLNHGQAVAVPTDESINLYVPAGTRHFGWLN